MQQRNLAQWLAWMESHHPRQIELGLDRVAAVAKNLTLDLSGAKIITVGGTNGKGSCVAFLDAILRAQGYRVGAYTSPHLLRYNERVRIDGALVDDATLSEAFAHVHAALFGISLTYFEFGTLAALWLFQQARLDVIVLEVGLGGRLDAVNLIDPDVAVLTTIDLDHQDWLGSDREAIGGEKAGIFRAGRPAICADPHPPQSVFTTAEAVAAHWYPAGSAYTYKNMGDRWNWSSITLTKIARYEDLPLPQLPLPSAAAALAALHCLPLPVDEQAIRTGLATAFLPGRFQRVSHNGVEIVFDVAHNPQAAAWLAERLGEVPALRTYAVMAMMRDKDVDTVISSLHRNVDEWFLGDLSDNPRALSGGELEARLRAHHIDALVRLPTLTQAFDVAVKCACKGERIVVFGSFFTVAEVMNRMNAEELSNGR